MKRFGLLKIAVTVIAVLFIGNQVYSALYSPISTVSAQYISQTEGITANGIILRNEKVIEKSTDGVVHFAVGDGLRVASGGVIADVYSSSADSVAVNRIAMLEDKIKNIETIQSYNDLAAIDINLLNGKIDAKITELLYQLGNKRYGQIVSAKEDLLTMLNRRQMVVGETDDFSAQLNELKSERDSLVATLNSPVSQIKADNAGFFVSSLDGYESLLTADDFSKYTVSFVENLKVGEKSTTAIGKLVADYTWYICAMVDADQALLYQTGDNVKLHTSLKTNPYLNVKIEQINQGSEKTVIIFSCREMNSTLASLRSLPITIVKGEYEGLKVPKSAIRVVNNETGVYTVSGMELKFTKVEVLFMDDDYVICKKADALDTKSLRLYDKIVVRGKNLYDGKIID